MQNHLEDNTGFGGQVFCKDTQEQLAYVQSIFDESPNRVWSYSPDYEPTMVHSGWHICNLDGFIITEEPCEDDTYITVYEPDLEIGIEDKRKMVIDDVYDSCLQDSKYMYSVLQSYYDTLNPEDIEQLYNEAFADRPELW